MTNDRPSASSRRDGLVALSALAQLVLSSVAWLIQAGSLSLIIWAVVAVLALVTWVVPGIVAAVRADRKRAFKRKHLNSKRSDGDFET